MIRCTLPILLASGLAAAVSLCDFNDESDFAALRWASRPSGAEMGPDAAFASSGAFSLKIDLPAWRPGAPEWPAFELKPKRNDWTPYDRLVVDLINAGDAAPSWSLFISDSKTPFRQGLSHSFEVPSRGWNRCVIPLSGFPAGVDRADVAILHFFTTRPAEAASLHLDSLTLLKPGEEAPEPQPSFLHQTLRLELPALQESEKTLRDAMEKSFGPVRGRLDELAAECTALIHDFDREPENSAHAARLTARARQLPAAIRHWHALLTLQAECRAAGLPAENWLTGLAGPTEKVLPRYAVGKIHPAREIHLSAARREKESVQVIVAPLAKDLRGVHVSASDLSGADGETLPATALQCEVTGYVETKSSPPYGSPHVGWWPDPILDFLGPIDVKTGDAQSFWIRLEVPENQAAGLYRGKLAVHAEGETSREIPLEVKVRNFSVPKASPLPVAITFSPHDHPLPATEAEQLGWRQDPEYPVNAWRKHKLRWVDFLADYYINYDSLYRNGPPDFEALARLKEQGRLKAFNLGIFDRMSRSPEEAARCLEDLRAAYRGARELGILEQAYIYGFDERNPDQFQALEKTARILHREFPDVLLMTTSYDHSYGQNTVVKTIGAWCPLTPKYNAADAARARAEGRQVWWYICCSPHKPHANMFIESAGIEGRLLMGAMSAKEKPDGFLYYQTSIWNSRRPITRGPFTDWDPRSWTNYHGDGSWTCCGPDGVPLPTVRLENFRDGLEDYAYHQLLEKTLRSVEADPAAAANATAWLEEARKALIVPSELMRSMEDYSRDPALLAAWREQLGDTLDRAPVPLPR